MFYYWWWQTTSATGSSLGKSCSHLKKSAFYSATKYKTVAHGHQQRTVHEGKKTPNNNLLNETCLWWSCWWQTATMTFLLFSFLFFQFEQNWQLFFLLLSPFSSTSCQLLRLGYRGLMSSRIFWKYPKVLVIVSHTKTFSLKLAQRLLFFHFDEDGASICSEGTVDIVLLCYILPFVVHRVVVMSSSLSRLLQFVNHKSEGHLMPGSKLFFLDHPPFVDDPAEPQPTTRGQRCSVHSISWIVPRWRLVLFLVYFMVLKVLFSEVKGNLETFWPLTHMCMQVIDCYQMYPTAVNVVAMLKETQQCTSKFRKEDPSL